MPQGPWTGSLGYESLAVGPRHAKAATIGTARRVGRSAARGAHMECSGVGECSTTPNAGVLSQDLHGPIFDVFGGLFPCALIGQNPILAPLRDVPKDVKESQVIRLELSTRPG